MKTIYLILFFSSILFSCNMKQEQMHIASSKNDSAISDSTKIVKDTIPNPQKANKDYRTISGATSYFEFPRDKKQLNDWRRKVLVDGNSYYYGQLLSYYYKKSSSGCEIIKLTQAMIDKDESMNNYKTLYYSQVKRSKLHNKKKYMKKAIKYLNQALKEVDNIMSTTLAKVYLSEIYREGIYVKRDTIIANYLDNGGCNLDSILQARKVKNK